VSEPQHEQKSPLHQLAQGFQHYGREFVALYHAERETIVELFTEWDKDQSKTRNVFEKLHLLTNILTEGIRALPYTLSHGIILWSIWHYVISPAFGFQGHPPPCPPQSLQFQP